MDNIEVKPALASVVLDIVFTPRAESIKEYIRYLGIRNRDYSAWIRISGILETVSEALPGATTLLAWAKLALDHALDIYNRTPRADNAVANRNKARVLKRIDNGLAKLADCGASADVACLSCSSLDDERG
ncbi:hypothetical protein HDV00_011280 [Rhizophlyctis rosea]|nr:hypothetical protein HDV00_011280 [Rhizophlyctis rosea]